LRRDVEAALEVAGCSNFIVLDETAPGVPGGWLLFRDVKPTRAVRRRDEAHILNALCPLRDIAPHYVGGIRLTRRTWLAGFPPRIRFTGELEENFLNGKKFLPRFRHPFKHNNPYRNSHPVSD
jgi:hypothetical protein